MAAVLPAVFGRYALFHIVSGIMCLTAALLVLRRWNRLLASAGAQRSRVVIIKPKRLPRVGQRPMLWKEVYGEAFLRLNRGGMIALTTFWFGSLFFGALLLGGLVFLHFFGGDITKDIAATVRYLTLSVGCLMILSTALHACGAIAGERDRRTLESLLATPLENRAIVWSKWWGSVVSVRKAWWYLAAVWATGIATNALSIDRVPWLILALLVYIVFAAGVGLWCSLVCRTALRATAWTLIILLVVCFASYPLRWGLSLFVQEYDLYRPRTMNRLVLDSVRRGSGTPELTWWHVWLVEFEGYGASPTATLSWLSHPEDDNRGGSLPRYDGIAQVRTKACLFGLASLALAAIALVLRVQARFARVVGRLPLYGRTSRYTILLERG
jgi:ABC-type transport system involved in multi-copper enzyme maturation permease subunit